MDSLPETSGVPVFNFLSIYPDPWQKVQAMTNPARTVFFVNSATILLLQRKRARKVQARTQVIEAATKPNGNLMLY